MALLNTYSDDLNMVVHSALSVIYSARALADDADAWWFSNVEYTRHATKSYSYVGMTYEAAKACAAEKRDKYTRAYSRSAVVRKSTDFPDGVSTDSVVETGADIAVTADGESGAFSVDISVNETDVIVVSNINSQTRTPQQAFAALEATRGYDGDDEPEEEEEETT